ncbi:MAG: proline--tRNA ligase [Deltaproteobacteria bacterium]|nr:proline--tRNA ligase [Deltaproteobacteria bacterium]
MRYSEMFLPTIRELPSDAEVVSHQLMLRAGMIRRLANGIYSYLPFGYRAIRKVEQIVREEMNKAGAQELFMPMVQPAELWQESGRWQLYGKELLRFKDRGEREFCLGPTHEEVITDIVRNEVKSYRHLPRNLYQIQMKFRDEVRPRFGVMRCREFAMKDAYSFDADYAGLDMSYQKMHKAYCNIFSRCGLEYRAVEADTGSIGGSSSHEFMVMAQTGESEVVYCPQCQYAANMEKAEIAKPQDVAPLNANKFLPMEEIYTPNVRTIEEVCNFLQVSAKDVVKTLIMVADGNPVAILIRGDEDVNEIKVKNYLQCAEIELADETTIMSVAGSPRGFVGAVGIKCRVIADYSLLGAGNVVMGANKEDYHSKNANPGRDYDVKEFADLRVMHDGDVCPRCGSLIRIVRGIEVGHIFKLGTKYSEKLRAVFLDAEGKERVMIMGCYGIGIGRTVASSIEQNHDESGIIWPMAIAPFDVIITTVNINDELSHSRSQQLYDELSAAGVDVLWDDRNERAGVKFNDADLLGIPLRITIGPKKISENIVEIKERKSGAVTEIGFSEICSKVLEVKRKLLG